MQSAILVMRLIQATILTVALYKIWKGITQGNEGGVPKNTCGLAAHFTFLLIYLILAPTSLLTLINNHNEKENGATIAVTWIIWVAAEMIN